MNLRRTRVEAPRHSPNGFRLHVLSTSYHRKPRRPPKIPDNGVNLLAIVPAVLSQGERVRPHTIELVLVGDQCPCARSGLCHSVGENGGGSHEHGREKSWRHRGPGASKARGGGGAGENTLNYLRGTIVNRDLWYTTVFGSVKYGPRNRRNETTLQITYWYVVRV